MVTGPVGWRAGMLVPGTCVAPLSVDSREITGDHAQEPEYNPSIMTYIRHVSGCDSRPKVVVGKRTHGELRLPSIRRVDPDDRA